MIMFGNSYHKVCQNCGRAHSGRITEQFRDGDGKIIEIVVCTEARYNE